MYKRLIDEFPNAYKACEAEYNRHLPEKGDSWKEKLTPEQGGSE
jgi:hypothetical protein